MNPSRSRRSGSFARTAAALAALALAVAWPLWAATPGAAAPVQVSTGEEHISSYKVAIVIEDNGDLQVTETIAWDFGVVPKHGIFRDIPVRYRYDDIKKGWDRRMPVSDVEVSADPGTPADVKATTEGDNLHLRIGDPNQTITGPHTYTIRYRQRGALNHFPDHDELYYNPVGHEFPVPIDSVQATVTSPADIPKVACFAGPRGSTLPCDSASTDGRQALFLNGPLGPYEGLTVVVAIPPGTIHPTPTPILQERWSLQKAFAVRTDTVVPAVGLGVVALAGVVILGVRVGRDRRFRGSPTDVAFGNAGEGDERVPLRDGADDEVPVEFVPPDGIRPGQVGTLIDEQANTLDVTATIVDLAVRGYLRITEIPKKGWFGKPDWQLDLLKQSTGLLPYESRLLTCLFKTGPQVLLSDLKDSFATELKSVQNKLYDDVVKQGWYNKRPDRVRQAFGAVGIAAVSATIGVTVLLAKFTSFGLVGVALVLAALGLLAVARSAPRRTPKGYGTYRRVLGFRRFIEESEKERAQFAERQNLFSEYLPYAVVFGATEKWAKAFAGLDGQLPTTDWYVSPYGYNAITFGHAMDSFTTTTSGTIASVPASSGGSGFSGGSSGGGGGGGGGGSW